MAIAMLASLWLALSPTETLYFRLGVPIGSKRMQRLQRVIDTSWKDTSIFEDTPLLDRRVAALEREVGPNAARLMIMRSLLLTSDLEHRIPERMAMLKQLLPGASSRALLVRAPALLLLTEATLKARVEALEAALPKGTIASSVVRRAPTLLQLASLEERLAALDALVPGLDRRKLMMRAPSLLAYQPNALSAKLEQLAELFGPKCDAAVIIKREPRLLTLHVDSIADKLRCYEECLPGVDVRKLLASDPSLLSYDVRRSLPLKLEALEAVLPGADIRLVRLVPQLLEYDVNGTLAPKVLALRRLFHPSAAQAPPSPPNMAQRIATSKLLAARRGARASSSRASGALKRSTSGTRISTAGAARAAASRAASGGRLTNVGLLRLAALDVALVERRMGLIAQMLLKVDVVELVSKQPALLRRDVENSLRPRLAFLSAELGSSEAVETITSNPRLLLSSYGALGRLTFVRETTGNEGPNAVSPSTALMAPKAAFERFPAYPSGSRKEAKAGQKNADVGALRSCCWRSEAGMVALAEDVSLLLPTSCESRPVQYTRAEQLKCLSCESRCTVHWRTCTVHMWFSICRELLY